LKIKKIQPNGSGPFWDPSGGTAAPGDALWDPENGAVPILNLLHDLSEEEQIGHIRQVILTV